MILDDGQVSRNDQFGVNDRLPSLIAPKGELPLILKSLDIKVVVTGHFAQTTQIMCFYNPNNRKLEGNLTFPLPDNGVVCGYALDIEGIMVDGVIVPKQYARKILEAEIRKGIDPGLIEQVQGNVYKTRIYPIPPKGTRTISITYSSDLVFSGNDAAYHLPLLHAENIEEVSLRIEVQQSPVLPEISGGQGNATLTSWKDMWVAEAKIARGMPTEDLQIRLPNLPDSFTMLEKTSENETFFCISNLIKKEELKDPWMARRIAIAWDASGSRHNTERDIDLLKAIFAYWQNLTVDLQVFSYRKEDIFRVYSIQEGKADDLFRYLKEMPYDGATNLAALDFTIRPHAETEAWFLFSDGLATLNKSLPKTDGMKVFTLTSQVRNNSAYMQHLADQTGGKFINLHRTQTDKACEEICFHKGSYYAIDNRGCEDVTVKEHDGRLIIMGKLVSNEGAIKWSSSENTVEVRSELASKGDNLARQWAGQRINYLSLTQGNQTEGLLALAQKYGIVSSVTSLLVLENIEQYLEYNIEPPATRAKMLAKFRELKREVDKDAEEIRTEHLETVVELWQQRVEWWRKEFKSNSEKVTLEKRAHYSQRLAMEINAEFDCSPPRLRDFGDADESLNVYSDHISAFDTADESLESELSAMRQDNIAGSDCVETITTIKPWSPDTPYLEKLKIAHQGEVYSEYLKQRKDYALSPAFFFDCGAFFLAANERQIGLRVLSNLLEMNLEDVALMRMYGWRLQQAGELDQAVAVFESILALRDDEPQSHRDLALALGDRWEKESRQEDILKAMELLYTVVLQSWERFPEIEIIALMELNRLIHLANLANIEVPQHIDNRLVELLDLDIRISMSWDADLTDIDLHVFEPNGEHAYYGHQLTAIGGLVSRDFRDGYGPEEYVLRRAFPGPYQIKANYYGSHQQTLCGPCTVTVNVFSNYCRTNEKKQVMTLRLEESGQDIIVGEVVILENQNNSATEDSIFLKMVKNLRKGMSVDQITREIGQPQNVSTGSDENVIVLTYILIDRTQIQIGVSPELLWAKRIKAGVEVNIVPQTSFARV